MADRIIKGDSGNDVIIQNNDASRKIEVTNSGDVEVTGDLKATTVKATNLKANDGTAGLVVADSTGEVTSSGGLKATNVKATNLKANDGTASLEIADSTGDIGFSGNTNLKIKLPSGGGIYESDGTTEILTESSGVVTLKNVIAGSGLSGFATTDGITMADQWRLSASITSASAVISTNLERVDDGWFTQIGTGMSESSGVFTFPQTGVYLVTVSAHFLSNAGNAHNFGGIQIQITEDGVNFANEIEKYCSVHATSAYNGTHAVGQIDVDNTSNIKVRFKREVSSGDFITLGATGSNQTTFTFIRLGDT